MDRPLAGVDYQSLDNSYNRVMKWIITKGYLQTETVPMQALKLGEEYGEFVAKLIRTGYSKETAIELGDMLVVMIGIAETMGWHLDKCLRMAHEKNADRTGQIINGVFVKSEDL